MKFIHLFVLLLLVLTPRMLKAQEDVLMIGLRAGHNATFGGFVATSLETHQTFCEEFSVSGGVQYSTIGRTAIEARPAYTMNLSWGRLSAEVMTAYTHLAAINSIAIGGGACVDCRRVNAKLGYYYRLYGGRGGWIAEPFNMYYELSACLLQKSEGWNMRLTVTNNEIFELERHYQPSFIAECSYRPARKLGVSLGIGCKPVGMFNMSADNYQTYLKTGVCYRW